MKYLETLMDERVSGEPGSISVDPAESYSAAQNDYYHCQRLIPLQTGLTLFYQKLTLSEDLILSFERSSPFLEFGCLLSGRVYGYSKQCCRKDREWGGKAGDTWFSYSSEARGVVEYSSDELLQVVGFLVAPPLLDTFIPGFSKLPGELNKLSPQSQDGMGSLTPFLTQIIRQILEKGPSVDELDRLFLTSKSYEFLFHLQKNVGKKHYASLSVNHAKAVERAVEMIQNNLETPPPLEQIAKKAGICATGLNAGFKEAFGTTVFGYIRQERLTKAKELMECEGRTVSEAAWESGYQSLSSFHRAFYAQYGVAPSFFSKLRERPF